MTAQDQPSRALAVLAAMAVAVLVVAAAASPTLNAVVIGIGLGLGAVVGAICTFVITSWLLRNDSERADSLIVTTIGGAVLGLLCVLATLLVLRADVPTDLEDEQG